MSVADAMSILVTWTACFLIGMILMQSQVALIGRVVLSATAATIAVLIVWLIVWLLTLAATL